MIKPNPRHADGPRCAYRFPQSLLDRSASSFLTRLAECVRFETGADAAFVVVRGGPDRYWASAHEAAAEWGEAVRRSRVFEGNTRQPHVFADLSTDAGWADDVLARATPPIRFAAVVPMHDRSGAVAGHLLAMSRHPRTSSADAITVLERHAALASAHLIEVAHAIEIGEADHRVTEEELRLRNAMLIAQQETSLDGILVVDGDGRFVTWNARFRAMWDIPESILATRRDDLALAHVRELLVDPEAFLERVRSLYDHPDESSFDEIHLRDGRVFSRYSSPMVGQDGRLHGRVWYFRDETERRRAERALRESEERLAGIIGSALDAIISIDADRIIRVFNAAAESVFGCAAPEAINTSFDRFASPALRQLLERSATAFDRSGSARRYLWAPDGITAVRRNGEPFPIEATISRTDAGGTRLMTIILRDVNERTRAEHELRRLEAQNIYLRAESAASAGSGEIVGASDAIRGVLDAIARVAETNATVLITGETGTGKELVAKAIHERSGRRASMLVKVNCAALPGSLIESELFGHERGAFTGATTRQLGRFEAAAGGTILLDEIGDLPLELQSRLLRVLQEGEFERVGSAETRRVDARVIACTNVDLERAVAARTFRADLYYRLNVFPIHVPPLRQRREDIPLLARHLARVASARFGRRFDDFSPDAMDALLACSWPGNVRELQNVVERAVIVGEGHGRNLELRRWLHEDRWAAAPATPAPALDAASEVAVQAGAPDGAGQREDHSRQTLAMIDVERQHIQRVLESTGWRVSGERGAARLLGLKPTTLESRMKRLGIRRPGR